MFLYTKNYLGLMVATWKSLIVLMRSQHTVNVSEIGKLFRRKKPLLTEKPTTYNLIA